MMSARLPTVSEPVTSPSPSALAPLSVAISMTSRKPTGGKPSEGVPFHGTPIFQVKRMVSNMLAGAIEVASNDSDTSTPALRMRSSATRGSPASPSRNSESVAKLSGVLVRAMAAASRSLAGM